ncbi:MAG: M48 family metallopeptidase [Snowella sp.]|nr:M48 family metallopeptidase [Snowella sp.]
MRANFLTRWQKRSISLILTAILSFSFMVGIAQPSYGQSWLPFLFQGIQVLQLSNLSNAQEVRLGQQINRQLIQQGQFRPSRNRNLNAYINEIGQRLAQTSQRPDIPYTFQVVSDRDINAFATMGGFVYINQGIIESAETEAELASVIAHEIAHIVARHSIKQMRDVALSQGLMGAAGLRESTMVQLGVQLAFNLPNSREAELEADQLGLRNLQRAGYAPIGMVAFMQKLLKRGGGTPEILNTHPDTRNRIVALQRKIDPNTAYDGEGLDPQVYRATIRSLR